MHSWEDFYKIVNSEHSKLLYHAKEHEIFHNTYQFEQLYYGYVRDGNIAALEKLIKTTPTLVEGTVADNSLRQAKNIFIACITLTTRYSIQGGLDIETAYQLSDIYIQRMEKLSTPKDIWNLRHTAAFDFASRVIQGANSKPMSKDIYEATLYISNHTNRPLSVVDVAEHFMRERSAFSKKFKKETGVTIHDFILRRKLEEAKNLLRFTNQSIGEISMYLCFSSQSNFQNVFKKAFGLTPNQFRNQK